MGRQTASRQDGKRCGKQAQAEGDESATIIFIKTEDARD
jgi:hypothetical protein